MTTNSVQISNNGFNYILNTSLFLYFYTYNLKHNLLIQYKIQGDHADSWCVIFYGAFWVGDEAGDDHHLHGAAWAMETGEFYGIEEDGTYLQSWVGVYWHNSGW